MKINWKKEVICSGAGNDNSQIGRNPCGVLITATEEDIILTYRKFWDGEKLDYFSVKCPHCQSITDLDEREIPQIVKDYALFQARNRKGKAEDLIK